MPRFRPIAPASCRRSAMTILAIQLAACAPYQSYQPAPLAPTDEAQAHNARQLDDSALQSMLAAHGITRRDSAWDSRQLALAAVYFRPDITVAERALAAARAGELTAGVRPYPSVTVAANDAAKADEGHSTPWSFSVAGGFTLERGGKRQARIARARMATLAAKVRLELTAWDAVESTRQATASALGADVDLADARAETVMLGTVLELLRDRYRDAQITRVDLARSETEVRLSAVAATEAARARTAARSALARALAVPLRQVDRLPLRAEPRSGCAAADSLPLDTLKTLALRTHPAVGVAVADYAVAEADLRLQIATQYPDVVIGPGIAWEQGVGRWILSLALPTIAIDRARGPIAEAAARRAVQAARVKQLQDSILAAVDSGVATCAHLQGEVLLADSLVRASGEQLALVQAAYQRGEIGRTEGALAQLALVRAERTRHQVAQRAVAAGVALEGAIGIWLSGPPIEWRELIIPPGSNGTRSDDHR